MPYMKYEDIVKFDFKNDPVTLRDFGEVIKIRMIQYLGHKMNAFNNASGLSAFTAGGVVGGVGGMIEGDEINNIDVGDAASFNIFEGLFQ